MHLNDFVDFCAENALDACEPTSYYFPETITNEQLMDFKQRTFRLGLDISGTAIGNDFALPEGDARQAQLAMTREWIDHAATLGAPVIRIFAGKLSPWFGVNFDSGNFRTSDPYGDLEKIAPYAVNAQIKVMMHPRDGSPQPANLPRLIDILKDAGYRGFIVLEYEEVEDPFEAIPPYLRELRRLIAA